jgi:MoaA/NifB/PqqE/SkfB family radical SAM enzyme
MSLDVKQAAVGETRHWVRVTRSCNNRCVFCHDVGAQDGRALPYDEICDRIAEGRRRGAERLILSGGEATIHPRFLDLVRFGTAQGYGWVQVVTNGRMFGYRDFAARAWEAGLREATFSMHAHRPDLYDRIVGVDGAFQQALKGLRNAIALRMVVSVDVVLSRMNLPHLKEILEFFMSLGVYEFDLLHLVPFGRGFDERRAEVFADEDMVRRELARALELAGTPGLFLWTNRLPIRFLEGHEDLFQDPHKLYDEVLGEREAFRALFSTGEEPACRGERCPFCFLRDFCEAAIRYRRGEWDSATPAGVEAAADACARALAAGGEGAAAAFAGGIEAPLREDFLEARSVTPSPDDLRRLAELTGMHVRGLPACLGGDPDEPRWPPPDEGVANADGTIVPDRFIAFYIRRLYRVKSSRCRACALDGRCAGLHVNLARLWGLRVLEPMLTADSRQPTADS